MIYDNFTIKSIASTFIKNFTNQELAKNIAFKYL